MHDLQAQRGSRPHTGSAKSLGAFYTDAVVAEFLVRWAVRSPQDIVLDPSFGGGVFLDAVSQRLQSLGAMPPFAAWGIEIDPAAHAGTAALLAASTHVPPDHLLLRDFFATGASNLPPVSVVVGNPPYIRYQRFGGELRRAALACSIAEGVRLPELSSSWAPFVVHSGAILQLGGRLAMVVPMELHHSSYARPVLDYLRRTFGKVVFLTFRRKLFPDLSESTLLLLGEDKGAPFQGFFHKDLADASLLSPSKPFADRSLEKIRRINSAEIVQGRERLIEYLIPARARDLYRELVQSSKCKRLGELADVGIGYVTGANSYFHMDDAEAGRWGIPRRFLKPAVRRGRTLTGLYFRADDWRSASSTGEGGYLLHIPPRTELTGPLKEYIRHGESLGVHQAYKCRTRTPWFSVPHVYLPDGFLTYMSGDTPLLVVNEAGAVSPNSLHILRMHPLLCQSASTVAALWQTSLTKLSVEIEGHPLGGGMLKLEPSEAESVAFPWPNPTESAGLPSLAGELDALARSRGNQAAQDLADETILRGAIGLSRNDCHLLHSAAKRLRDRRQGRSASHGTR